MTDQLKACPFCGEQPKLVGKFIGADYQYEYVCENIVCPKQYTYPTKKLAFGAWNTRVEVEV